LTISYKKFNNSLKYVVMVKKDKNMRGRVEQREAEKEIEFDKI
jgi:hypothetical protein